MEVTDKLDFTLGEVEILNKQLSKEKDAFQQMWVDSSGTLQGYTFLLVVKCDTHKQICVDKCE